jgi:hypothetical protein
MYVIQALKKDIDKNREKKEVTVLILGTKNDLTESRRVDHLQVGFAFHQYYKAIYHLHLYGIKIESFLLEESQSLNGAHLSFSFSISMNSKTYNLYWCRSFGTGRYATGPVLI